MMPIEVFGQHGIFAVWRTVLSQVTRTHVCSHDSQVAASKAAGWCFRQTKPQTRCLRLLKPPGFGVALPLPFSRLTLIRPEV